MNTYAIILAAGKGTRMKSTLPKVLHPISGIPMVEHLVRKLEQLQVDEIFMIVGHGAETVQQHFENRNITFIPQTTQLGTAHAVLQAAPYLQDIRGKTLVLTGDTPLLTTLSLTQLVEQSTIADGVVLTTEQVDPFGYGRIIRGADGQIVSIVEEKDASPEQKTIKEVNTGIFCFNNETLFSSLPQINNQNAQSEYYLTDIVDVFCRNNHSFTHLSTIHPFEAMGINDRYQLAIAENYHQEAIKKKHLLNGVTLQQPETIFIEEDVIIEPDVILESSVQLKGHTTIKSFSTIGSGSHVINSTIDEFTTITHSFIHESQIGKHVTIGPYAHIRPFTVLEERVKIGNFVEIKKSSIESGTKVSHLSYIGDAIIGKDVNVGCGAITVNYDGLHKHETVIEDDAFIGCNVNIIAPVHIGKNATVAAGSTITQDVPPNALAIARERQTNKEQYNT